MPQPSRARWRLECAINAQKGVPCTDTNSVDYRAKQFAAQNGFCNAGDTSYPGSQCAAPRPGTSQSVSVAVGADQVRATVSQQQPAYLAAVLGMSTVNIRCDSSCPSSNFDETVYLGFNGFRQFSGQCNRIIPQTAVSRRTVPPQMRLTLRATAASTSTRQASQRVAVLRRGETNAIT